MANLRKNPVLTLLPTLQMEGRPRHGQEVDSYLYFTPSRPVRKQLKVEEN